MPWMPASIAPQHWWRCGRHQLCLVRKSSRRSALEREAEDNPGKLVTVDMNVVHSMALASMHIRATYIYIYIICYIYACMYVYIFIQQEVHILQNIAIRAYLRKSRCLGMCALNHARTP